MTTEITKEEKDFLENQKFYCQMKMRDGVTKQQSQYWIKSFTTLHRLLERAIVKD